MFTKQRKFINYKQTYYNNLNTLISKINNQIGVNEGDDKKEITIQSKIKCIQCGKNDFKYICPKCKIKYCSVECYKSHSVQCTENFYKQNVEEELKSLTVDNDSKKKFKNLLKDYQGGSEEEILYSLTDNRKKHLEDILEKIESGKLDLVSDLTPDDWLEFNKFIEGNTIPLWKPFWESNLDNDLPPSLLAIDINLFEGINNESITKIKEIELNEFMEYFKNESEQSNIYETNDEEDLTNEKEFVKVNDNYIKIDRDIIYKSIILKYKDIPVFNKLSKANPSRTNIYTMLWLISSTVYLFRLYNGEIRNNIEEILNFIIHNCSVLYNKEIIYQDLEITLTEFFSNLSKYEVKHFQKTKELIYNDILKIFSNKFSILESLLRLYEIIHLNSNNFNKNLKTKLTLSKNKLIYYMSYLRELNPETIQLEIINPINTKLANEKNLISFGNKIRNLN